MDGRGTASFACVRSLWSPRRLAGIARPSVSVFGAGSQRLRQIVNGMSDSRLQACIATCEVGSGQGTYIPRINSDDENPLSSCRSAEIRRVQKQGTEKRVLFGQQTKLALKLIGKSLV